MLGISGNGKPATLSPESRCRALAPHRRRARAGRWCAPPPWTAAAPR
jgi:hypothetical protein